MEFKRENENEVKKNKTDDSRFEVGWLARRTRKKYCLGEEQGNFASPAFTEMRKDDLGHSFTKFSTYLWLVR
jgi:hypothetical protein